MSSVSGNLNPNPNPNSVSGDLTIVSSSISGRIFADRGKVTSPLVPNLNPNPNPNTNPPSPNTNTNPPNPNSPKPNAPNPNPNPNPNPKVTVSGSSFADSSPLVMAVSSAELVVGAGNTFSYSSSRSMSGLLQVCHLVITPSSAIVSRARAAWAACCRYVVSSN